MFSWSVEEFKSSFEKFKEKEIKLVPFDYKSHFENINLMANAEKEIEEFGLKRGIDNSYSNIHSIQNIWKGLSSSIHKSTYSQFKKVHNFAINTNYIPLKLTGKKQVKIEENEQILDLDFESVDIQAADFEKGIITLLNSHLQNSKWEEWWTSEHMNSYVKIEFNANKKRNTFMHDHISPSKIDANDGNYKDDLKLIRPQNNSYESEEELENVDKVKKPQKKEPEPKAFYDDWGDIDFTKNNSPERQIEKKGLSNHLIEETFEKYGLTNLWKKTNENNNVEEGKSCKEESLTAALMKKIPDYAFLIDSNICFPDDFFG